jgi:hypothetical protein
VRPLCREKLTDGFRRGFQVIVKLPARRSPNAKRPRGTWLVAEASHMQLGSLLRLLRSTRVVRLDRPSVALLLFESSDGTVCCAVGRLHETDRWCTTDEPQYGSNLPRLADGQRSDVNGFVCVDERGALTCTIKTGAGAGRGFHVDANGSETVGPVP